MAGTGNVPRVSWTEASTIGDPWPSSATRRARLLIVGTSSMGWKTCLDELAAIAPTWHDVDTVILEVGSGPSAPPNATPVRKAQLRHAIITASWRVRRQRRQAMLALISRADLVLFVNPNPAIGVLPELEQRSVPIGVYFDATVRNHAMQSGWRPNVGYRVELNLQRRLVARSEVVACMSHWAAHTVTHDLGGAGAVHVIPPSVGPRRPETNRRDDGPLDLAFAGNPWFRKGADRLLEWLRARPDAAVSLALYTEPPAPTTVPDDRRISHVGRADRHDVLDALAHSDCLVCPTRLDQSAFVIVEAAMAGTPSIAPRLGGLAELVDDGETGFVFGPHHDDELWRILDALVADPGIVRRLREATAKTAAKRFSSTNYRVLVDELLAVSP